MPRDVLCISIVLTILFFLNGGGRQSASKLVSAVVLLVVDVREDAGDRILCFRLLVGGANGGRGSRGT